MSTPIVPSETPVPESPQSGPGEFVPEGRSVDSGNGWRWITDGWNLFRKAPGMWVLLLVAFFVMLAVLSFVPVLGGAAAAVVAPVFTGGLMLGCGAVDAGRRLEVEHLFAGFRQNTGQLIGVGLFHLVASALILLALTIFVGANVGIGALMGGMMGHPGPGAMAGGMLSLLLAGLIGAALAVPVYAAIWFAPVLVVFHGMDALAALKASFIANLKNIAPMLIYGVILFVLAIIAAIPFSLGFVILAPVVTASVYTAYRDVFFAGSRGPVSAGTVSSRSL